MHHSLTCRSQTRAGEPRRSQARLSNSCRVFADLDRACLRAKTHNGVARRSWTRADEPHRSWAKPSRIASDFRKSRSSLSKIRQAAKGLDRGPQSVRSTHWRSETLGVAGGWMCGAGAGYNHGLNVMLQLTFMKYISTNMNELWTWAAAVGASAGHGIMGTGEGLVHIWDLATGTKLQDLQCFKGVGVSCIAVSDSRLGPLAVAGGDQLRIYLPSE
ncbi:hypothetical protein Acr_22g0003340 [Actinidia rufa]|uniref:Uncharacterized protein n=1 Tax=Actinidia rufa TaxID=165716 RepID=A0A7J0GJF0_9ERIC|nr:hypothetical protein Acr_22g0003340 [Actinidia rufa]